MHILHVGNHSYPCVGGVENVIWQSAREQAKLGHEVEIMVFNTCSTGEKCAVYEKKDGVTIHRVPQSGFSFYRVPPRGALLARARDKDIIHIHGVGSWLDTLAGAKNMLSGKLILTTHGGFFHTTHRGWLKALYARLILPRSWNKMDGIIYVSPSDKENFSFLPQEKTIVFPNGIEEDFLHVKQTKKDPEMFLFVGRLSENKHVERLIETFSRFCSLNKRKNPSLHIVGKDWENSRAQLEQLAREKGFESRVIFHGEVADAQKMKLYSRATIFVSASTYEGFGISVVEAMAAGCVVCVNDIPPFREFVHGGNGFLTDYSIPENAAHAWNKTVSLRASDKKIILQKARAYAEELSWPKLISKQVEWYRSR